MSFLIRNELDTDADAIRLVTTEAFRGMPYADGDEQDVIDRLRAASALHLSLIAAIDQEVVGQITFSPARAADPSQLWFALGPVSVLPKHQHQGIGSALIEQGLEVIRVQGALGCILTGNPAYYQRFGFVLSPEYSPANEPAEFFMTKMFTKEQPSGQFQFHAAFYEDADT